MKAYAVLFIFTAIVIGSLGLYTAQQDWSQPNYAASPESSLVVNDRVLPCSELLQRTCDLTDERVLKQVQPHVDVFLARDNLMLLVADKRVSSLDALKYGVEICGNRFWKESSAVFADTHANLPYFAAFIVWSTATTILCPLQA